MKTALLIRHGATPGNLEKRYIGRTDEPLCPLGVSQAEALHPRLPAPERIYVSPMLRARQTASILFPGRELIPAEDLRETDFGDFEGLTADELSGSADYRAWVDGWCLGPIPGGEAVSDFRERCASAFPRLMEEVPEGETAAFVVHGGVIMAILAALGEPQKDFYEWYLPNCGIWTCRWEDGVLKPATQDPTPMGFPCGPEK